MKFTLTLKLAHGSTLAQPLLPASLDGVPLTAGPVVTPGADPVYPTQVTWEIPDIDPAQAHEAEIAATFCLTPPVPPKKGVSFSLFAVKGRAGERVTLKTLVYSAGVPVAGLPIEFRESEALVGTAISTDTDARIDYVIPENAGPYVFPITVRFAGNAQYTAAERTTDALTVR